MSTPAQPVNQPAPAGERRWPHLPTVPEALASLLQTVVVALFLLTFVLQPFLIPSESMERTLLVGDFLLVDKQIFAPSDAVRDPFHRLLPYRDVQRGDIVVFHHADPQYPYLVKRVVGLPGDRISIHNGQVLINNALLTEPYVVWEPAAPSPFRDNFPARFYTDPNIDPAWWQQMQNLTQNGELVVPAGEYFMLGDNRNHSKDSRFWGLVPREAIVARPLLIYFSVSRQSTTDVQQVPDDRLGHGRDLTARLEGFARWKRIFHVVH